MTPADVVRAAKAKGWPVPGSKPYDLFVFGIRVGNGPGFDDVIGVLYPDESGVTRLETWRGTTDPGVPWLREPMNAAGCAAIAEGRHPLVWTVGSHKGTPALVQVGTFRVYRDGNRNGTLEIDPATARDVNGAGLNLHEMGSGPDDRAVGRWSAGCQGTEDPTGVRRIVALAQEQARRHGWQRVSYHLFRASELPPV